MASTEQIELLTISNPSLAPKKSESSRKGKVAKTAIQESKPVDKADEEPGSRDLALGDTVQYCGIRYPVYTGMPLTVELIIGQWFTTRWVTCRKPDGYFTTWILASDLARYSGES